ncbi:hypothetical protein VTN00DRAFT_7263 [Thermoascus crustaceus]|uniref:uncharacterized protein n=1 Tax=Thermoascus crustaceus TaxID=5088 RepID=UPI0037426E37
MGSYFDGDEDMRDPNGPNLLLTIPNGGYPISDSVSISTSNSLSPTVNYAPSSQTSLEWNCEQREALELGAAQNDSCPSGTDPSDLAGIGIPSPNQYLTDSHRSSASGLLGELSMSFTNPTTTGIHIQDPSLRPHLVIPSATDDFSPSVPERSELLNRIDVIRFAISNGRFPDARMREMNRYLAGISPIVTRPSESLHPPTDSRQRSQPPTPGSPFTDTSISRLYCVFCRSGKKYGTRGAWKRHITYKHRHCSLFRCYFHSCNWMSFRRDKVHVHIRKEHDPRITLTRDQINALEIPLPHPGHCDLCNRSTGSWDDYFRCLADHCCLPPEQESDDNNGLGARRHGDGGGGGSHGFNGGFPPDPGPTGFGGYGAPYGGNGNGSAGGYSLGARSGNYFTYSQPNYTYEKAGVCKTASCSPEAQNSMNKIDEHITQPQSSPSDRQARQKNSFPGTLSSELDHPSALPPDGGIAAPHRDQSTSRLGRMVGSVPPSDAMRPDEQPHLPKAQDNDRKRHRRGESDIRPSECRRCGHIIGSCSKCDPETQTADFCHNCRDNSPQRALARLASFLTNYDRYQAFTCNVLPNGTQKRDEIYEVVMSIDRIVSSAFCSLSVTNDSQPHSKVQLGWNVPFVQNAVTLRPKTAVCDVVCKSQLGAESAEMMRGGSKWALSKEVAISLSDREAQRLFAPLITIPRDKNVTKPGTSQDEAMVYPQLDIVFSASSRQMMPEPWQISWELLLLRDHIILSYWKQLFGEECVADLSLLDAFRSCMWVDFWPEAAVTNKSFTVESERFLSVKSKLEDGSSLYLRSSMQQMNGMFNYWFRLYAMQCLLHCDVSIDALNAELGIPNTRAADIRKDAISSKDDHHRRLSALWTRLRVVTTLLILQMSVATQHTDVEGSVDEHSEEYTLDSRSLAFFGTSISRCVNKHLPWFRKSMSVITDHAHSMNNFVHGLASFDPITVLRGHPGLESASFKSLTMKLCDLVECPITIE